MPFRLDDASHENVSNITHSAQSEDNPTTPAPDSRRSGNYAVYWVKNRLTLIDNSRQTSSDTISHALVFFFFDAADTIVGKGKLFS